MSNQKLELTWVGKENRPKLEPRILVEGPEKSYHAKHRVTSVDIFDNRLIFGDGLEHSIWLGLMRDRLDTIRRLLAKALIVNDRWGQPERGQFIHGADREVHAGCRKPAPVRIV